MTVTVTVAVTVTDSERTSTRPIMGWCEDPRTTSHQVTHGVEPGHRVGFCGVRVVFTGGAWSGFTPLGRCAVCRMAITGRLIYARAV